MQSTTVCGYSNNMTLQWLFGLQNVILHDYSQRSLIVTTDYLEADMKAPIKL